MDADHGNPLRSRLLDALPSLDLDAATQILSSCPAIEVAAGEPYFRSSLPPGELLVVERGFVVLRARSPGMGRAIITCEGGPGRILLPPAPDEVVVGLVDSRLTAISDESLDALVARPSAAKALLEQLATTLAQNHEALGTFGSTRHVERVRRKLLQLARNYGRVVRDGIRIDFPISHMVIADMVGSSRETVTRALDELQRDGFVARRGRSYRLLVTPDCVASATLP